MQQLSTNDQILVYVERGAQSIDTASVNLLAKAKDLAVRMSCKLIAVTLGEDGHEPGIAALAQKGVDGILAVEHAEAGKHNVELFSSLLAEVVRAEHPRIFLVPHTVMGVEVACLVAGKLGIAPATNLIDIEPQDGSVIVTRPMFGGTRHVKVLIGAGSPIIGTLQSRTWTAQPVEGREPAVTRCRPSAASDLLARIKMLSTIEPSRGGVDLTKAQIIVSIGRGIGAKTNIPLYRDLADLLGGVLACSRPIADLSWLPSEHLVGISGSTVRPKVYLACGISGAYQHLAAMQDAQTIIAINSDPTAPIFEVAHYGIVMDLNQVVPCLLEIAKASPLKG